MRLFGGWSLVAQSSGWSGTSVRQSYGPLVVRLFGFGGPLGQLLVRLAVKSFGHEVI